MRSITTRLVLAFLTVSVISTLLVVLFTRWRSREEFRSFLFDQNRPSIVTSLSDYYAVHGSWQGISEVQFQVQPPPPRPDPNRSPFTVADETGRSVYAGQGYQVGVMLPASELDQGIPIQVDGETVGRLLISRS